MTIPIFTPPVARPSFAHLRRKRRGVAVLLVLGILAMTLALAYVMVRSQSESLSLQENMGRADMARIAAQTGTAAALRQMHESTWGGVNSSIAGRVDSNTTYTVSYVVGDSGLATSDPLYSEYPFRVTITSQGTSASPSNSSIKSTYTIRTIVQLARRALNTGTSHYAWDDLQNNTIYQWGSETIDFHFPFKSSGNVILFGTLQFCSDYPSNSTAARRYLQDLNGMRTAGLGDYRPFQGNIRWNTSFQSGTTSDYVSNRLGLSTTSMFSMYSSPPISSPGDVTTYRLYPGGPTYSLGNASGQFGTTISDATVQPSMTTNPLGLYRSSSSCAIGNNTTFTGALLFGNSSATNVVVSGTNVQLNGVNLPPLENSSTAYQLPLIIAADSARFTSGCQANVNGCIMAWQGLVVDRGAKTTSLNITGRAFVKDIDVGGRAEWDDDVIDWSTDYSDFTAQYDINNPASTKYFPQWMANQRGLSTAPAIGITPPTTAVRYHWPDWTQPVYGIGSGDAGLVWNIIRREEGL